MVLFSFFLQDFSVTGFSTILPNEVKDKLIVIDDGFTSSSKVRLCFTVEHQNHI